MTMEEDEVLGPCGCVDYHMADCDRGGAWLAPQSHPICENSLMDEFDDED